MGFFSNNCNGCQAPMLSSYSTTKATEWMADVVIIEKNGFILAGEYGGYGDVFVNGKSIRTADTMNVCCWHAACWRRANKPTIWVKSDMSVCQGFFFRRGVYDKIKPSGGSKILERKKSDKQYAIDNDLVDIGNNENWPETTYQVGDMFIYKNDNMNRQTNVTEWIMVEAWSIDNVGVYPTLQSAVESLNN